MSRQGNKTAIRQETTTAFRKVILDWFRDNGKTYPWRETASPYAILMAEILLQRTQAKQVVPVYERLIARFPSVADLAAANTGEIEGLITSLGLKKKARQIKETAIQLVEQHKGQVPKIAAMLQKLPGLGRYSANAVLVFAFGCQLPVVDANVVRLFERIFGIKSAKKRPREDSELWEFARAVLPTDNVAEYTWALIDFASNVCRARQPDCDICPMKAFCNLRTKERHQTLI